MALVAVDWPVYPRLRGHYAKERERAQFGRALAARCNAARRHAGRGGLSCGIYARLR